jgi:hypothetical protein
MGKVVAKGSWPRRDLLLLPLIAIGTILLIAIPTEWAFRSASPQVLLDSCVTPSSNGSISRARPNCVSQVKAAEGPWSTNRYNGCGYRTPESCGPKPAGAIRFAVIGSSTGAGYLTPYDQTMAALSASALRRACHRPVEFQNLGVAGEQNSKLVPRAVEALKLKPDMMLIVISPFDFELAPELAVDKGGKSGSSWTLLRRLKSTISQSRLLYMTSYFVLRDDGSYLPIYLQSAHNPDFMRSPMPDRWQRKIAEFGASVSQVAKLAKRQGVPAMLVFVPQRAQAALIASGKDYADDLHPHLLPDMLRKIAAENGLAFTDSTVSIPKRISSAQLFYAVNGHINARGHAMVSQAIMRRLEAPDRPAFMKQCAAPS